MEKQRMSSKTSPNLGEWNWYAKACQLTESNWFKDPIKMKGVTEIIHWRCQHPNFLRKYSLFIRSSGITR